MDKMKCWCRKLNLYQKVEKGIYTIRDVTSNIKLQQENDITTSHTGNILVSMQDCELVALLGNLLSLYVCTILSF